MAACAGCVMLTAITVLTSVIAVRGLAIEDFGLAGRSGTAAACAAVVALLTLRAARCGVFVNARDGVLIRRFDHTTRWSWSAVAAVESRPARLLTYGVSAGVETIWLVLADGEEVETRLRSIEPNDYSRWNRQSGVEWLDRSAFATALWTLRDLHRAAGRRGVSPES